MKIERKINLWSAFKQVFIVLFTISISVGSLLFAYYHGISVGFNLAKESYEPSTNYVVEKQDDDTSPIQPSSDVQSLPLQPSWGGPGLWEEVNKRRTELGVNPLSTKSELCTIASIRLNELLDLGTLDGHEGFSNMSERREDLKWIFEKYNLTEFLVAGADSPTDAVSLWENTLGHKKLLTGGEYVWGCIYAQSGFGVAITAF